MILTSRFNIEFLAMTICPLTRCKFFNMSCGIITLIHQSISMHTKFFKPTTLLIILKLCVAPGNDPRRYNLPTANEVSTITTILPGEDTFQGDHRHLPLNYFSLLLYKIKTIQTILLLNNHTFRLRKYPSAARERASLQ